MVTPESLRLRGLPFRNTRRNESDQVFTAGAWCTVFFGNGPARLRVAGCGGGSMPVTVTISSTEREEALMMDDTASDRRFACLASRLAIL